MDNLKILMFLRPNVKFTDSVVNAFSLETIAETYIGDDLPTQNEMDAAWITIQESDSKNKIIESFADAIQFELDKEAQLFGYDNIHTAVTYANETSVAKFSTDGKSFRKWRSLVWVYCYDILSQYEVGDIPAPTIDEMIAGMPVRV